VKETKHRMQIEVTPEAIIIISLTSVFSASAG